MKSLSSPETTSAYYVGLHPYTYRPGQSALIKTLVMFNGRPCFHLVYPDGVEDYAVVEDTDGLHHGGLGVFYAIEATPRKDKE